ncbi:MAG: glycosyltransferase family 4 protein [Coriobacteriia bacterium]|nr:glycosyltransferase family 4 protein [Coriobacteriia bacterium]
MRVLVDCRMSTWSGIGRYCQGLVRALVRTPGIGVIQMVAAGTQAPSGSAEVVEASSHPFSAGGSFEFGRIVRDVAPDITHALHFPTPRPVSHPLVVTIQDLTPLVVPGVMASAARRIVYRRSVGRAVRVADRIITPSAHTAQDVARLLPRAEGRITTVLLAADDFTSGPVGELPEWLEGKRFILSMGNTKPHKDLPTLLQAFAALEDESLVLVLSGVDQEGYASSVLGQDRAASRVRFTGPISDDMLRALYSNAELLAFPSLYEGFGLPPLEAMSFGTPVVVSAAASLPEVVGDAALTFAPGDRDALADAMGQVLSDAGMASELSRRGKARAGELTWSRTAGLTAAVYREAAAS